MKPRLLFLPGNPTEILGFLAKSIVKNFHENQKIQSLGKKTKIPSTGEIVTNTSVKTFWHIMIEPVRFTIFPIFKPCENIDTSNSKKLFK